MHFLRPSNPWTAADLLQIFIFSSFAQTRSLDVPFIQPISVPNDVIKGQSVTITCAVKAGTGSFTFRWSKDGQSLSDQPFSRIQTFEEYSFLHLKSVDSSRSGNYTCEVMNAAGAANYTAELIVYEYPEWEISPEDADVVSGADVTLYCSGIGVPTPTVTWKKVASSESSPLLDRGRPLSNGTLLLVDVKKEEAGKYECVLSNGIGDDLRKEVHLTVHVPPHIHDTYQLQEARSGHSAVLRCDVTAEEPLHVRWTTADGEAGFNTQETPLPNGLLSELYISRVSREDEGLYVCTAANAYGKIHKTVQLAVLEPPSPPSDVSAGQVERTEVTVQWKRPHAGNSPIHHYIVQYWRDTGSPPKLLEEVSSSEQHVLKDLRPGMSYLVRVIAENQFGPSAPSVPCRFSTAEDAPSGYPVDLNVYSSGRHELIVRWKAPAPDQRNGAIRGYELGYRKHYSSGPYVYREARLGPGPSQELVLDDLEEDEEYEVVVRAYNSAGKGPTSVPVVGRTKERGNLEAPSLWVESTSATSLTLRWSGNEDVRRSDLRHSLHYRAEGRQWAEKVVPQPGGSFVLTDLEENTLYYLYLRALSAGEQSSPSTTVTVRTSDPSFERSSMQEVTHQTTLVISLSVVISCVVIVCVIAAACVYVTRVTSHSNAKRDGHPLSDFADHLSTSRSSPLSRHNFRYVDVNSRPLLWCSTPAPPNDYPSPYATLPLRPTPVSKRWRSEDGMSPATSERSESLLNQRVEIPEDKNSLNKE